ncbi:MAG: hypothetical protein ACXABC_10920 [Candidatus Thorarchaeota archaeon]
MALSPSCGRATLWGFEGCGSMWSFYRDSALAQQAAQGQELLELDIAQAFVLDNRRRIELGSITIRFEEFLDCILPLNEGNTCPSPGCLGYQVDCECED